MDSITTKLAVPKEGIMATLGMVVSLIKIQVFILVVAIFNIT